MQWSCFGPIVLFSIWYGINSPLGRGQLLSSTDKNTGAAGPIPTPVLRTAEQKASISLQALPSGPVLVSACLAGRACRFDGSANLDDVVGRLVASGRAVLVCPEVDGGLGTPRPPAEIVGGDGADVLAGRARVVTSSGRDVTDAYVGGARVALAAARRSGARAAILKARSPSCGKGAIHDGSFSRATRPGDGVTAALLAASGIEVFTEEQLESAPGTTTS
jgi:uncharacterized protein YbbK (DUF523 family)